MKCNADPFTKDCCNQKNCCEECGYEDCHESCCIFDETEDCSDCKYCQYECDICGAVMAKEEYIKNNGFCQECANDRSE